MKRYGLCCLVLVWFCYGGGALGLANDHNTLLINEVMAMNGSVVQDPQAEYEDWIEIANLGSTPIDLAGMYLSDNPKNPTKWQFPSDDPTLTTIEAQGYLVIWADKDTEDPGLHTNFSLNNNGEELVLYAQNGTTLIDSFTYKKLPLDIAYGRSPELGYMEPTPAQANTALLGGLVSEPQFSHSRGFYNATFSLEITSDTEEATIFYTLNGTVPTSNSSRYTQPITISSTNCVRAIAIKHGWKASSVLTHTYLFTRDIIKQSSQGDPKASNWPSGPIDNHVIDYGMDPDIVNNAKYRDLLDDSLLSLPSFSFVTNLDHLFDPQTGMYVNPEDTRADSAAWERPVSIELIYPDGTEGFQVNAGFRLRGGYSRRDVNPKHAFRVYFRTRYGKAKLDYPLFEDEGVDEFDKFDLRTSQNYSWAYNGSDRNTMVREVFSRDLQGEMGHPYTRSRYYHLYINGQYWGVFQTQERVDAAFAESYYGGSKDDYDTIKSDWNIGRAMLATDGNMDAYRELYDMTIDGMGDTGRYMQAQGLNPDGTPNPDYPKLLDVENLIDFMIIDYFTGDRDGPGSRYGNKPNNIFCFYNRVEPDGFKWCQHDSEHSMGTGVSNLVTPFTSAGAQWKYFNPHWLHEQLAQSNPNYRMQFADHVYRHFQSGGLLSPEVNIERIENRAAQVEMAMIAESARWGDAKSGSPKTWDNHWHPEINWLIENYLPTRTTETLQQFKSVGWYPSIDPPMLYEENGTNGTVISMSGVGDIYYTTDGTDPRLPEQSDVTITTTDFITSNATKRVLVPSSTISNAWKENLDFSDAHWLVASGTPGGVGYETGSGYQDRLSLDMRSRMVGQNTSCFVRIPFEVTGDPSRFDVLSLKMQYDDGFVAYLNGQEVARAMFSGTPTWNSQANGNHEANSSESFDISTAINRLKSGTNLLAIHGLNVSLTSSDFIILPELEAQEVIRNNEEEDVAAPSVKLYDGPIALTENMQIKARALQGRTWSALSEEIFTVGPITGGLAITELNYHSPGDDDPNTEFIEIMNLSPHTINLKGVSFTEGITYTFDSIDLDPNGFVLVVSDPNTFASVYGVDLLAVGPYQGKLSNGGERITLTDVEGQVIESFRYDDKWYPQTDGRGHTLVRTAPSNEQGIDLSIAEAWIPSQEIAGSPGIADAASSAAIYIEPSEQEPPVVDPPVDDQTLELKVMNIDFARAGYESDNIYSGQGALTDAEGHNYWNILSQTSFPAEDLKTSDNLNTNVSITSSGTAPESWSNPSSEYIAEPIDLMADYLYVHEATANIVLSNLVPNESYWLFIYGAGDNQGQGGHFTVGTQTRTLPGPSTETQSLTMGEDYFVLQATANAQGELTISFTNVAENSGFAAFNGLQIAGLFAIEP